MKLINLIFLGAPGAGKGTQAQKVSQELNLPHIDTGGLIRQAITSKTDLGVKAKKFVEAGKLVPDELVINLIKERLIELKKDSGFKGFILDGYPRTIVQADALQEMLNLLELGSVTVINIKAPEELLIQRLTSRRLCSNKSCGEIYNLISKKPKIENKCDLCGAELYQRADDSKESVVERLKEYYSKTAPLEEYYESKNKLKTIDGTKTSEDVYNEIVKSVVCCP